jgi:hypothetical protein
MIGFRDGKQQGRSRKIREKLGSEPIQYRGEVHDGLAVSSGKDRWQADSRIWVLLLVVNSRL